MKNRFRVVFGVTALLFCVAAPQSAPAELRWRVSGNACQPQTTTTYFMARSNQGFEIHENSGAIHADGATCTIPTGPELVDLGDGDHPIRLVNVRLKQDGVSATVATYLRVHDYDSNSYCTCAASSSSIGAGAFQQRSLTFDCGSCGYDDSWGIALDVSRSGAGDTQIKLITVYD